MSKFYVTFDQCPQKVMCIMDISTRERENIEVATADEMDAVAAERGAEFVMFCYSGMPRRAVPIAKVREQKLFQKLVRKCKLAEQRYENQLTGAISEKQFRKEYYGSFEREQEL